jgi:RHS repeat-associated protein
MPEQRAGLSFLSFLAALLSLVGACAVVLVLAPTALATTLSPVIESNTTLTAAGSPYMGAATVAPGVTLKISPGVELIGAELNVEGTLKAEGTASEPILFEETGTGGIYFAPESGASVVDHVEMVEGGFGPASRSAITIRESSATITNSKFVKSLTSAIGIQGGSPEIADNTIRDSKRDGIDYSEWLKGPDEINIHDNLVEGSGATGISVSASSTSTTTATLGSNTLIGNKEAGIAYQAHEIPTDITSNTLSANTKNVIELTGTVTQSATWTDGGYKLVFINGGVSVPLGVTLKIDPGVEILQADLNVEGTLKAEGTASEPILFEETGTGGIYFAPESGTSVLDHVEMVEGGSSYGFGSHAAITIRESSPTITNSIFRNASYAAIGIEGRAPEIAHNVVRGTKGIGISYSQGIESKGEINIHDNLVEDSSAAGIRVSATSASTTIATLGSNALIGNKEAIYYQAHEIPTDITSNTLSANTRNVIELTGTLTHSATWTDNGYKLVFLNGGVSVAPGVTLKIDPGVEILQADFGVEGTLKAEGTAGEPILFEETGIGGIYFSPESGASVLDHIEMVEGGSEYGFGSRGAIVIKESSPTIVNSAFRGASYTAIEVRESGAPLIEGNEFQSDASAVQYQGGREPVVSGGPEIASNVIRDSKYAGILYSESSPGQGEVDIHDNLVEGCGSGIEVYARGSAHETTLDHNTVTENEGVALSYSGTEIPPDITTNTLSGNAQNVIELTGSVIRPSTWTNGGAKIRILNGNVTVAPGVTLKIDPGVEILQADFGVEGTLKAEGTAGEPILFEETGIGGIYFSPESGASVLDHIEMVEGGSEYGFGSHAAITIRESSPTITNSIFRNASYAAIEVDAIGNPRIEWNRFRLNAAGLLVSGERKFAAPNNDWNCTSGPKPAGCGAEVSSNVIWQPAATLSEQGGRCRGKETQCGEGADPVSLAIGQLDYSHRDLLLPNRSVEPLEFARTYNSGSTADTGLGPGWSQTGIATATELPSGEVLVVRQDGRQDLFHNEGGGYEPPSGVHDNLVKVKGSYELTAVDGTVYRFDQSGRIASVTDDHGLETTYGYDEGGRLSTITDPSGQTLSFSYDGSNHIAAVEDSTGRVVSFTYDGEGNLATATDALGGITKYSYESGHRLKTITDPRGNVILTNAYNGEGKISEQEDGVGAVWKLAYSSAKTVVIEPDGGEKTYRFDGHDRVISESDALGHTTKIGYDEAGNVDLVERPSAAVWRYGHDGAGNLTSVEDPEGGKATYAYNGHNKPIEYTDARGKAWRYEWSSSNDLEKSIDPEGGETSATYNTAGEPITITDPDGHTAELEYDGRGDRTDLIDPLGHEWAYGYDSRGYLTSETQPGLNPEVLGRDALGDLLSRTTPEGHETAYEYDPNGLLIKVTDPAGHAWKIERNAMERPVAYEDPLGQRSELGYDGDLNLTSEVNRRGKETAYRYDAADQLREVEGPEGETWEYGYDSRGNRDSVTDPRGYATHYAYDLLDRLVEAQAPLESTSEYGYDADGNLTSFTDPDANTTHLTYDGLGRLTGVERPLGDSTGYEYDPAGNLITKTTAEGTLEYSYDEANRLLKVSGEEGLLRSFAYEPDNRLAEATDEEGKTISAGYTEDGELASLDDGRGQTVSREYDSRGNLIGSEDGRGGISYVYDALNRIESMTDPQGHTTHFKYGLEGELTNAELPNGVDTTNAYNSAGRLAESTSTAGKASIEALTYGYDADGNVTSEVNRLAEETTYSYDALDRLAGLNSPGPGSTPYEYDRAGNRTKSGSTTYSYNALNQLTSDSAGTTYSYDGDGRLTKAKGEAGATAYGWDPLDQLRSIATPGHEITYSYDALGRRSVRTQGESTQVAHYGDLGDDPILDTNTAGEMTGSYVQGPAGLLEQRSEGTTSYPLADRHGDVTTISGEAGEVESRQSYGPWGEVLEGPQLEMGYLGAQERRTDPEAGLIQMGARPYDPSLGSFLSEDPVLGHVGNGASLDHYPYVWDNPLNRYDLNGRDVCLFGGCASEAANDVGGAAEGVYETAKGGVEGGASIAVEIGETGAGAAADAGKAAWHFTVPAREFTADRAREFWKKSSPTLESVYSFAGSNWQACFSGSLPGAYVGASAGTAFFGVGALPGAIGGGIGGCAFGVGAKNVLEIGL